MKLEQIKLRRKCSISLFAEYTNSQQHISTAAETAYSSVTWRPGEAANNKSHGHLVGIDKGAHAPENEKRMNNKQRYALETISL